MWKHGRMDRRYVLLNLRRQDTGVFFWRFQTAKAVIGDLNTFVRTERNPQCASDEHCFDSFMSRPKLASRADIYRHGLAVAEASAERGGGTLRAFHCSPRIQIEVTFDIDANDICQLSLQAFDRAVSKCGTTSGTKSINLV